MDNQIFGTGGDLGGGRAVEIGGARALAGHVLSVLRAPEGESADDAGGGGAEGADPGMNCIKIGLPGKLILRDYFQ